MARKSFRKYTLEFKQQAAKLAMEIGVSRAALQLGVPMQNVGKWKRNHEEQQPQSKKEKVNLEAEVKRLEKENEQLKQVNYILKRAAAFFSQDHLK